MDLRHAIENIPIHHWSFLILSCDVIFSPLLPITTDTLHLLYPFMALINPFGSKLRSQISFVGSITIATMPIVSIRYCLRLFLYGGGEGDSPLLDLLGFAAGKNVAGNSNVKIHEYYVHYCILTVMFHQIHGKKHSMSNWDCSSSMHFDTRFVNLKIWISHHCLCEQLFTLWPRCLYIRINGVIFQAGWLPRGISKPHGCRAPRLQWQDLQGDFSLVRAALKIWLFRWYQFIMVTAVQVFFSSLRWL